MPNDDLRLFDVRTLERKLRRGLITKKDYEKFLKSLPDVADQSEPFKVGPGAVGDDDDDDDFDDEE